MLIETLVKIYFKWKDKDVVCELKSATELMALFRAALMAILCALTIIVAIKFILFMCFGIRRHLVPQVTERGSIIESLRSYNQNLSSNDSKLGN